jgi:glycosyltransferase involved in cell wall biosynthesis
VILSVAALNRYHKRLDWLIEEVAMLPQPRPFLLLVGQEESETPVIRMLAARRLGPDGHSIRSVERHEIADIYRASDVFVLASLGEGLPRALIEALGFGLPCVAHDYPVTQFALGDHGELGDLAVSGELARLLARTLARGDTAEAKEARRRFAHQNFSWDRLRARYVKLLGGEALNDVVAAPSPDEASAASEPDRASIH